MTCRVADIERSIAAAFPPQRAEDWDHVGLIAGDPKATVTGVVVALDPTLEVIRLAAEASANVVVTHHPAFLSPPKWITPGAGGAGVAFAALSAGIALISAHTNLDRDPAGQRLLPERLGLTPVKPLERSLAPHTLVTVYAPPSAADAITTAMAGAGAGRIGDYEKCAYQGSGTGHFCAPLHATPATGKPGECTSTDEVRIEMVCPRARARGVVAAAVAAHPYEEPLVVASEVASSRNAERLGMVSTTPKPTTLGELAERCSESFSVTARVWGDPDGPVTRVATATGSGGSLIGDAMAAGAQVLVAGEVRYHDALDAVGNGLAVIELGHDVSEWPLVGLLSQAVKATEGLADSAVTVLPASAAWWTTSRSHT